MSLPWSNRDREAVERILSVNPPPTNLCEEVATQIVGVARRAGWDGRRRRVEIVEGFVAAQYVLPKRWPGLGWQYHVLAETRAHGVDAITGADGHPIGSYLQDLWEHADCLRLEMEED